MMKHLTITSLLLFIIASCTGYKTHKYPKTIDDENQKNFTVTDHVDFYSKSGDDQLKYAKHLSGEGDYKNAVELFLKIYENAEIDSTIRQEALLYLGKTYSNVLFADKDYQKALYFLEKLLQEFPQTELRPDAIGSIENIKKLIQQEKN